jgi:YARHG domain
MKNLTILFLFITLYKNGNTQIDERFTEKPYNFIIRANKEIFYTVESKKRSIYFNGKPIDSLGGRLDYILYYQKNFVGSINRRGRHFVFAFSPNKKIEFKNNPYKDGLLNTEDNLYSVDRIYYDSLEKIRLNKGLIAYGDYLNNITSPYNKKLSKINPYTGAREELLFDLDELYKDSIDNFSISQIEHLFELNNDRLFICTAFCSGGCEYYDHFIYSRKEKRIEWAKYLKEWEPDNTFYHLSILMKDSSSKYYLGVYDSYGVKNPDHTGYFIFDEKLKVVSRSLAHSTENIGYNFESGKLVSYNILSPIDDGRKIILPFKFSLYLERSLYRIYANENLLRNDILQLDKQDLEILKKMIQAKHNFKFEDSFYQGYFNLFDFYRAKERKAKRLIKVDHLFTPKDKENMSIIVKELKK